MHSFKTRTNCRAVLVGAAVLAGGASIAHGSIMIEVAQESAAGAGDFDANILGVVETFDTDLTAEAYYNWDTSDFSFDPPSGQYQPATADDQSSVFFGNTADGLTLFHVHDNDETSSSGGSASNTWTIQNDTAEFLALDDANGDETYLGGGTADLSVPNFGWSGSRTDGAAIGSLDGDWAVLTSFDSFNGLNTWKALSVDGTDVDLALEVGRRARFRVVPTPGAVALFGLAAIGFRRRRRR